MEYERLTERAENGKPYLESAEYCLDRMIAIAVDFFESHGKELQNG